MRKDWEDKLREMLDDIRTGVKDDVCVYNLINELLKGQNQNIGSIEPWEKVFAEEFCVTRAGEDELPENCWSWSIKGEHPGNLKSFISETLDANIIKCRKLVIEEIIAYLKERLPDMGIVTDNGEWGLVFEELKHTPEERKVIWDNYFKNNE